MRLVSGAPRPVVETLRVARALRLRIAGGVEKLFWLPTDIMPPLWIRRHTGPLASIDEAAAHTAALLRSMELVAPGASVADAGCGYGVMAQSLGKLIGPTGEYLGFDIYAPAIRWAQRHIAAVDPRCRFVLLRSPFLPFPAAPSTVDFVLAKSLFTHLAAELADHVLREIARVLVPTGRALVTAFLFEPGANPYREAVPYPASDSATLRWRVRARPKAAIAYERVRFSLMIREAGLEIAAFQPGFWPGRNQLDAQDVLVLKPRTD